MKLAFFSITLNHHQAGVADAFYEMLNDDYCFIELSGCHESKGAVTDYSSRPYLIKAWQSSETYTQAMGIATSADVCVFSGVESIPFEIERLKLNLLSFDMGERMLKKGIMNLASPRIMKLITNYHLRKWNNKKFYKLCCSAYTAADCSKLGMFVGKCYKWGYFTTVADNINIKSQHTSCITLMWCARLLTLKHPELVLEMAKILKDKGYNFRVDIFGDENNVGPYERVFPRQRIASLIKEYNIEDKVWLKGSQPNDVILQEMQDHDIFLFTSDRMEGWGAVANESLANGCVLIASDNIGSSPYLIQEGENGFTFESGNAQSLAAKVEWLINHREALQRMKYNAHKSMKDHWNPRQAAMNLLTLIDNIKQGKETSIAQGPCSKA